MAIGKEIDKFVSTFLATYKMMGDNAHRDRLFALEEQKLKGSEDAHRLYSEALKAQNNWFNRYLGGGGGGGGGGAREVASDPALGTLEPHQKSFLNAVAGPESAGAYNVRFGGADGSKTFAGYDRHPGIKEKIVNGPNAGKTSDAAGRYQFLSSTWNTLPPEAKGDGKFTPENQDRAAWWLAQRDYKARTGRNLDTDLREGGLTSGILGALSGTWEGFKTDPDSALRSFKGSIGRYSTQKSAEAVGNMMDGAPEAVPPPPRRPKGIASARAGAEPEAAVPAAPPPETPPTPPAALPIFQNQPSPNLTRNDEEESDTQYAATGGMIEPSHGEAIGAALHDVQNSIGSSSAALPDSDPEHAQRVQAFRGDAGAVSPEVYDALLKAVNPDGMNPNAVRDAMNKIHGFYASKGDRAAASKAAGGVLQAARARSRDYGKMAGDALQQGNYPLAARALMASYNELPDGKRVTAEVNDQGEGHAVVYDNATDKPVEQFPLNPKVLGMATMRAMAGGDFYYMLAQQTAPQSRGRSPVNAG